MKLRWHLAILFLYTTTVVAVDLSPKDYYDPNDEDDKVILWKELFTKVNTILVETNKISQKLLSLEKSFVELNNRQDEQDKQIRKIAENVNSNTKYMNDSRLQISTLIETDDLESRRRQEDQGNQIQKLAENVKSISLQITQLTESADVNKKSLTDIRMESNKRQEKQEIQIVELAENINTNFKFLNESQRKQEDQCNHVLKLKETADFTMKYINDSLSESNKRQDMLQKSCKSKPPNWTTILRRQDGSVNFTRGWNEYKTGFGDPPNGEFFIGLNELHEITTHCPHELMVVLKDWNNEVRTARYDAFEIGGEDEKYAIKVLGKFSGDAGDSLRIHSDMKFSTFDEDNDMSEENCALGRKGGWWFKNCSNSHLNGPYMKERESKKFGIYWHHWKLTTDYSYKYAEMKLRPKSV